MKKILIQMGVCAILAIPFLHAQEAQDLYLTTVHLCSRNLTWNCR